VIVDNPERLREIIEETHPYFTHQGAEEVVTTMKGEMDAYAARFGVFTDKVWREKYLKQPGVTTGCISSSISASMAMISAG